MTDGDPTLFRQSGHAPWPQSVQTKPQKAARAYLWACHLELEALKPGNVHIHADGHGMTVADFRRSAILTAPIIADLSRPCGERIRDSVMVTMDQVGCNTNLGILLLCAPLLSAFHHAQTADDLAIKLNESLSSFTLRETAAVFTAIARANPGGLGQTRAHDIHEPPTVYLREAMNTAANRDSIARQYATGFQDIFDLGIPAYHDAQSRYRNQAWSASYIYMTFLATRMDGHVLRRWGTKTARHLRMQAQQEINALESKNNSKDWPQSWKNFDRDLKQKGINPGSSADLTVATLLTARLQDMLQEMRTPVKEGGAIEPSTTF